MPIRLRCDRQRAVLRPGGGRGEGRGLPRVDRDVESPAVLRDGVLRRAVVTDRDRRTGGDRRHLEREARIDGDLRRARRRGRRALPTAAARGESDDERGREGDGAYRPALKITTREFAESIEIRVRDNGVGVPLKNRDKLFQPFFTTKPTGEGTGLGLSISYEIVTQQHGGTITADSEVGDFTEFTVRLPRRRYA